MIITQRREHTHTHTHTHTHLHTYNRNNQRSVTILSTRQGRPKHTQQLLMFITVTAQSTVMVQLV